MIKPEVLDAMVAAGCTAEQIAAAVKADQASSSGAARQARYRARKASQRDERDVTTVTVTPEVSPKKETSPTPPKEKTTPSSSEAIASSPRGELMAVVDEERARSIVESRQKMRKPLTVRGAQLLAAQLARWHDPNEAADAMVLNGWQGFKPEYLENRTRGSPQKPMRGSEFFYAASEVLGDGTGTLSDSNEGDWVDAPRLPQRAIGHNG